MRDDIKINDRALALQDQIIEKLEKVFDTDVELDKVSRTSRLKLPGRLPGRSHESVATAVLPLDCHLVNEANHF